MSYVNILEVQVLDNPSYWKNPFKFEIKFESQKELQDDLEWKIIYVGSAEDEQFDQTLESILVGPVQLGTNRFIFQAECPDSSKIPQHDILGVTVVLLTCSYRGKEFVRVGYYVNNEYETPEMRDEPPPQLQFDKIVRNILAAKPRITRFPIDFD